jgi:hypothetical protein
LPTVTYEGCNGSSVTVQTEMFRDVIACRETVFKYILLAVQTEASFHILTSQGGIANNMKILTSTPSCVGVLRQRTGTWMLLQLNY